jgi:hypothetical protein
MKQYQDYSDSRHKNGCIFCHKQSDSRDHIPARTFLVKPYPPNLHVLPVCTSCNNKYSQDEEYVSFLLNYLKHLESGDIDEYLRLDNFSHANVLEERIFYGLNVSKDELNPAPYIEIEVDRIKNVLGKYAFAHFCFERGEPPDGKETHINFSFANKLADEKVKLYNEIPYSKILPEVGSRLFQRIVEEGDSWMVIQEHYYRYYISQNQPYVRIVISDFLFSEIIFCN